jgi:hydroxymethylbilane synthase
MPRALRVATRGSVLARWQAERVVARLGGDAELVVVTTTGDLRTDTPIHAMGGTGVFVKEVQQAVLDGRADVAVHSAKDLPASPGSGAQELVIGAVPERADWRDALVGSTLDTLPTGALVGTGSVRRRAQLAAARPDLTFGELRGNIGTRLEKAGQFAAIVVALAALERLGHRDRATDVLATDVLLPQVGQGTLAVECRAGDDATLERLAAVDRSDLHRGLDAERAFLARLGGGCNLPCGALATVAGDDLALEGMLASPDGRIVLRSRGQGTDGAAVARGVVDDLLASGGRDLLDLDAELPA